MRSPQPRNGNVPRAGKARGYAPGPATLLLTAVLTILSSGCQGASELEEWTLQLHLDQVIGAEPVTANTAFYRPTAIGFDDAGNIYVLDSGNHRVQVFGPQGDFLRTIGEPGQGPGQLTEPQGMHVAGDGRVWVSDTRNRRIQPYTDAGDALPSMALDFFPLGLVITRARIFVQRMPQTNLLYGPDPAPLVQVFDRVGIPVAGAVEPRPSTAGILYMLENMLAMAPAPGGGIAVASTHFSSLLQLFDEDGDPVREVPVLYKAGSWAPLGRRPAEINDASIEAVARTASDLAWDAQRGLFWVLAGYVDRTPEGEWIVGREAYRYAPDGAYRGSVMLPQRATAIACAPDGRVWTIDIDGVVRAFRVTDPDIEGG